jgi:hypothetical protein
MLLPCHCQEPNNVKCHFATAVWGDVYTDLYLKVALPTQLSAGNLPAFADRQQCLYAIHTTSRDARAIRRSPAYAMLQETLPTEIVLFGDDEVAQHRTHTLMSECHRRAIAAADAAGAAILLLPPDAVWSDGSFSTVSRVVAAGKRVVIVAGVRVLKETFVPTLVETFGSKNNAAMTLPARELVRLTLEHLHPVSRSLFWDAAKINSWPSHLYWHVPGEGMLARCFHLHPLLVDSASKGASFSSTVDDDWIEQACQNPDDVYVVEDSDELMVCEMSKRAQVVGNIRRGAYREPKVARWVVRYANPLHRALVQRPIRMHCSELSPQWREVESLAERVVSEVFRTLPRQRVFCVAFDVVRPVGVAARMGANVAARTVRAAARKARGAARRTLITARKGNAAARSLLRRVPGMLPLVRKMRSTVRRMRGMPEPTPPLIEPQSTSELDPFPPTGYDSQPHINITRSGVSAEPDRYR